MDYSTTEINLFLVTVTKVAIKVEEDLYYEPNNTHQHLHDARSCHRNMYKRYIAQGQVVRFKIMCSIEEKLKNRFKQLKQWSVKCGYKDDHVDSEIERLKLVKRTVSFQKRDKKVDDSITLVFTHHPVLNQLYQILRRPHKHVLTSPRLHSALPSPPTVAF